MTSKEFDNLLKRVPVKLKADCSGFDPDLAAAYLERRLNAKEQASYQEHLSVCTSCRRMVTQLIEFSDPVSHKTSLLVRTLEILTAWSTTPQVRYALPVIAVALAISLWFAFQTRKPENVVENLYSAPALQSQPLTPVETKTSVELASDNQTKVKDRDRNSDKEGRAGREVVLEKGKAKQEVLGEAESVEAEALAGGAKGLVGSQEHRSRPEPEVAARPAQVADTKELSGGAPRPSVEARKDASSEQAVPTDATAGEEYSRRDDRAKKAAPGRPQRVTQRVGDKVFHLRDGVWVDEKYADSQGLRVVRVRQGEQRYVEAVRNSPKLEDYFNLGSRVIVVLDGVVYDYTGK